MLCKSICWRSWVQINFGLLEIRSVRPHAPDRDSEHRRQTVMWDEDEQEKRRKSAMRTFQHDSTEFASFVSPVRLSFSSLPFLSSSSSPFSLPLASFCITFCRFHSMPLPICGLTINQMPSTHVSYAKRQFFFFVDVILRFHFSHWIRMCLCRTNLMRMVQCTRFQVHPHRKWTPLNFTLKFSRFNSFDDPLFVFWHQAKIKKIRKEQSKRNKNKKSSNKKQITLLDRYSSRITVAQTSFE